MLKLNVNQEKQLNFEMQIGGVQADQIVSFLRIEIDEIEYGFPGQVKQESVTVNLPALNTVVARKLKEGDEVSVKLDVIADGRHLTPWKNTFILSYPLVVEAKIVEDDSDSLATFKTKLVTKGDSGDSIVEKSEEEKVASITESEEEMTERIFNKVVEKVTSIAKGRSTKKAKVVREDKVIAPKKRINKEEVKNIEEEGVYAYMARAGTKNEKIQKLIYEQAEIAAGTSVPVEVLKQVVKILKKKR
jgi:hypothetical protein